MNYGVAQSSMSRVVATASPDVRAQFIRKVYTLFFGSLLITVLSGTFCSQETMLPAVLAAMPILLIGLIVCSIILAFVRRTVGINLAVFGLFAALLGAVLGPQLMRIGEIAPGVPMTAAALTIGVFGLLTLYVFTTRKDFTFLGGFLFMALVALLIAGVIMMFIPSSILYILYCFIGILIFSGYVLYDTSNIMNHLEPEQAIVGAIELYLDFLNLFMLILNLLLEFNRRSD